jgi:hypothetical protein
MYSLSLSLPLSLSRIHADAWPNVSRIFCLNARGANKHLPTDTLSPAGEVKPGATAALTYAKHHSREENTPHS